MAKDEQNLKKQIHEALFGKGVLTIASFRIILESIVNNLLIFKNELLTKIDDIKKESRPTDAELRAIIRPLIPDVQDGVTPTRAELLALIQPLIPKVEDGKTPSDAKLLKLIKEVMPEVPVLDTGEEMIRKINHDKSDLLIRKGKVEGWDEIESRVKSAEATARGFINTGSYVYDYDMSALLDGVTTTFTLPANARILILLGSSDSGFYRKNVDYTYTASTITFTSQVAAATQLASGQTLVLLYKLV